MSTFGSQQALNASRRVGSKGDLTGGGTYHYARSDVAHGGGNGYDVFVEGYKGSSISRKSMKGGGMTMESGPMGGMSGSMSITHRALQQQSLCNDYMKKAEYCLQTGTGDAEYFMGMAKDAREKLKGYTFERSQLRQPNENVVRSVENYGEQLKGFDMGMSSNMQRRRSTRKSCGGLEESERRFCDAMAWITQQKRLIETSSWGDDPETTKQQLISHQRFHASLQMSTEMQQAIDNLKKRGDKDNQRGLEQEFESLQKMSNLRTEQLRELIQILQEIITEIMWVNEKEEEELVFDWGDKNVELYIPKKQESYSKLMSTLEEKEKDVHKLKAKTQKLLKNNHPASYMIEAYMGTLQTQWTWLLEITKCIDTHLKENAAYAQFFREANDTYKALQKEHETIRQTFTCDKNTSLEDLKELLKSLELEKETITNYKSQVQHLTAKSKSIVRLKPRNPEERSSSGIIVKALTDFKQDQKVILKDNEAILKDNSQRTKWHVTGPGGLDMLIPSVCLIVPPPNPLSVSLANKNDQYFEAIMSIWNQLYINVKSLIAWHYCLMDINYVNSLTISMLSNMRPEDYRQIMKKLETHFEEFKISSSGSEMFGDEDKRSIENQVTGAQAHYDKLVVELPTYVVHQEQIEVHQVPEQQVQPQLIIIQQPQQQQQHQLLLLQQEQQKQHQLLLLQQEQQKQQQLLLLQQQQQDRQQQSLLQQQQKAAAEEEAKRLEEERRQTELKNQAKKEMMKEQVIKKDMMKVTKTEQKRKVSSSSVFSLSSHLLSELHALRLRMDAAEGSLSQYVHICFGDDGVRDCGLKITQLESVQDDVDSMRDEYLRLRERILKELENMNDLDKAQFLRSEIGVINQKLGSLESSSSAYVLRLRALRDMLESIARAQDIVKVHEARLTEKDTTSLSSAEVNEYMETLKNMKAELGKKTDVLTSMNSELSKASHWNSQMDGSYHRCDLMLSKFTEQVGLLSDRWRRIQAQIDTRLQDLQLYLPQLQQYKLTNTSISEWIDATRRKQDAMQATKIESVQELKEHITNQKALNTEIKAKRETIESVLRDNETCVNTVKDYETDLASYTSGLETLLNVPIKRTMLTSPSIDLNQEAIHLQTRYMELLTLSGDYYKYLGELLKNMEELKMRNTQIDLLEEELRLLREEMQERNAKNKSLEEAVAQFKLQLSQSQEQLLSLEEVKQTTVLQCSATKDSLDSTQSQLADLNTEVEHLKYLLGEEKRKTKLAEERYTQQQEEYDSVLRKRQQELETVSWSKVAVEKSLANKEQETEQKRRQLAEESARLMELQKEMSKVRTYFSTEINNLKLSYESQIQVNLTDIQRLSVQRDEDTAELQIQYDRMDAERRNLEDELRRLRTFISQTEEHKKRVDEEACNQRAMLIEDGHKRREMESQMELLMRQRDEERNQHREELAEVLKTLQEKNDQLVYVTHGLEEETRRRKTTEEGKVVLEQSLAQLQVKLNSSLVASTQLRKCEEELLQTHLQLERENKERCRVEDNMSNLQGRIKDLQAVRDSLEGQVENLRIVHQEEVGRRRQIEAELEKTTVTMTEYTSTIARLRQCQEQASTSEKKSEEKHIRLKDELEKTLRQNQNCSDQNTQLSAELKTIKQQLLLEQSRVKEANLRHEGLYKTIEEKSKALNENSAELQRLKELIETQTKEQLRMEVELRAVRQDQEELLKSKKEIDDELSSQITALELQLQASERNNAEHRNLVSELSSEREKMKLEAGKIQKQVKETNATIQSLQSKYSEIVSERDSLLLKLQRLEMDKEQMQRLEEEQSRIKLSLESEFRTKQRLQEENDRVKRDLSYWKDQCDGKQSLIRQYDTDKDILEREKKSLKSEIETLMKELRELEEKYKSRLLLLQKELQDVTTVKKTTETELKQTREPPTLDASSVVFDGVRKPVTAKQLLDCGVLDKPTYNQLVKGHKIVPEVSAEKKVALKGTGPIAGVIIESPKGPAISNMPLCKLTFTEAKRENLLPPDSIDLLLDAQAATGHIIDPRTNQKLTVEEAYNQGVIDDEDRERLLAAEAATVGYSAPGTNKPLSVFQAMKKGLTDKTTTLRLLQAQESVGGILDPILSVFLPRDIASERNLIDDNMSCALNQRPELYLDPETEKGVTYMAMKRRCKIEPHTGLLLLPIPEKVDPSNLVFDGVRKPVTAKHLLDCGVLDKPTFKDLENGKKTVPEVSVDKTVNLKGTGPIAGVIVSGRRKMSLTEAKQQMLLPDECADLLLEAQAATGHIIDPKANKKLTVEEACAKGLVDLNDLDRLLASEAAAIGYKDPNVPNVISVFQAMKTGLIDDKIGLRLLQAQESVGGILDPNLSVFLPRDTAIKRKLFDENLCQALYHRPEYYIDPETEQHTSYQALKETCKIEPHTGLLLLPISEKLDPSKLVFDGVRKPVTAKQLFDCEVLNKPTLKKLMTGDKTVPEVSGDKKIFLKGTGSIAGVTVGPFGKMSLSQTKVQMLMPPESADLLLEAQAATGHVIDPMSNQKLTVEEACARGVVDRSDRDKLLAAEAAAVGYKDPRTGQSLSVCEAIKKGLIDKKTGVRLLQAQESAGGILDPNLSVFLPRETAMKRNLLDEDLCRALNQNPECYLDPDTERDASYGALKRKCKIEPHTGLMLLPLADRKDPSKLMFDGVRKPVSAQQLLECGVLDKPTFNKLIKGEKTVPEVSVDKKIFLKGTGSIAGVNVGSLEKMSLSEAKKQMLMPPESADLLLEAQAATGHIIDPMSNQKLTVEEACARGVVDRSDQDKLLAAEAAAVGYKDPRTGQSLSVCEAIKKGLIDKKTGVRLLQAQESAGGILDPNLSVFLPRETSMKRNLLDEDLCGALNQNPECYLDPDTERDASYGALKRKCKIEPHTGLMLLPLADRKDPSKLMFDGVRKPVSAQQLLECGVLDKPTFNKLIKGEKTVPEVSVDKKRFLKGTGSIAGVNVGSLEKMSLSEAKKQMLMPPESADLLLEAQAATGHIIDPMSNQKLTVEEACARGVVDRSDRDKLLAAEAAAVGYKDPRTGQSLSVFEAIKKGLIDKKTGVRLLHAQESAGGILDPNLSVFLPKETAMNRNLLDEDLCRALNQNPECYLDPDTERDASYGALKRKCKIEPHTGLMLLPLADRKDPSKLMFDGVRKPVSAQQLLECGVLDKPTFNKLIKGEKTVPDVSVDKKIFLKGTGSIAGVNVGSLEKMSLSEAKKQMLMPPESADLLLEAQAATGHIIDPMSNQKLTVEEACARGVVDRSDRDKLLAAEAAAVGYKDPRIGQSLSVFEAIKKGLIDKKTGVRLLQAQESAGGILDPNLSVFLPRETAMKRNLLDEDLCRALNQNPECYLDPDTERDASYGALKRKCKIEPHTGLMLLPLADRKDPSKLMFDGVRKPVSAQQLLECGVLDKPTFNKLIKGEKTVPEVSVDKKIFLKGTGSIAGVNVGSLEKMSLSEAKKQMLMPPESADLLLEAQAATGHIIDPMSNQKLTVEEACARGVVDRSDRDKLLAAEAAAVGYKDPRIGQSLSVFEAIKKGLIDKKTGVRLLQAQESAGGILDPNLSVFLPRETAMKRNLLDEDLCRALNQNPECYLDPDTERDASYGALKRKCKIEPHTGLMLLPLADRKDPSKLMFDGVRKPVSAQQLLECGVLDKPTFNKLIKGEKTVPEVSVDKKIFLKGTGSIAGVNVGSLEKMSLSEAKKQMLMPPESADLLLEAQAATGHIIDPMSNQKLTVEEACARGVVDRSDRDKLLAAEAAAVGYKDPRIGQSLSVFEAIKKGLIDKKTGVRLLQAQESAGGILDPNLSVFLPKETAMKRNLLDEDLCRALNQNPECYLDPDTERDASYGALKRKCKIEPHTGVMLLPLADRKNPSKMMFDGVRKPVSAQQLLECGVLDKPTFNKLIKGEKTVPEVSVDKKIFLKGTGSIAGVNVGSLEKMSLSEAKKQMLMPPESADLLLEAQAATGHITDPISNQKLTVEEACARGVVDRSDRDKLLAAEAAAVGYKEPRTGQSLSVFEAIKKGLIDKKTGVRLLQAQESAGGILDPNLSVFLPKETAMKRNLLDEDLCRALNQNPECYLDPDTERDASYGALKRKCKIEPHTGVMLLPLADRKNPSKMMFDGVRKPVSAQQLLECGVLDKPTFNKLIKGEKTVPEVSVDKKIFLKGTGSIAGVNVGSLEKMSLSEAKKQMLMPPESADLLLEAQAATGHITDPISNQKLTVEEACARGVVDRSDRDKLLAAEAAAVGYKEPRTGQSLSVFEAIKKGLIDKKTGVRLLQAQESAGGILDPNLSVFLPKETAMKRNLLDEDLCRALNQNPECYLDPDTERDASYGALKRKCKTEPHTGLMLLPLADRKDPSKLMFDGVRKPVSAQQLLECGVLDKPTFNKLIKGEKTVPEVSVDKKIFLKGTGSIAGVNVGSLEKMSLSEAKKQMLMPPESADLLLEAQAATGHIIDPISNQKLTVEEACARGVVDRSDRDKLLAAEAAAVGYKDPRTGQSLSVFDAIKKGLIDKKTGVRLLQAQESAGGILDPNLSVFLPKETAMKRNLLDEDLCRALNQNPECYLDPDTERDASYGALKRKCKTEPHTGLMLLPLADRKDSSKLMFDGVRKPVSAQQLLECGVLDKPTFNKLIKGEKTVPEVSVDKKIFLKGTGSIAGVNVGSLEKMSLSEAKKQMLMPPESADLLLEAQAATGHITDPMSNQKLTVEEACARGVVDRSDQDKLLAAEAAAVGYKDPRTGQSLSVFDAIKKGLIDKKTGVRLLQAQESAGGILDPNLSVFLPRETAMKRNLLDEDLCHALNQNPECYLDPDTERGASYGALKKKCKIELQTGLVLLALTEKTNPSKLMFDGLRKPVSAQQLLDCGVLDKATLKKLIKGEKTVQEISKDKKVYLKGTGPIAGVFAGRQGNISFSEAKKLKIISEDSADLLLEAQAATGHIIDPKTEQKLTAEEACIKGVVDFKDQSRLLAAERAAVGYKDPSSGKLISLFEAMKKGIIDETTGLRLLQAQDSFGGILDPNLSVFLPKDTAIKHNLLDDKLIHALKQNPACYLDPETQHKISYGALKAKCNTNTHTGLHILPVSDKIDPSKLLFDAVHKTVTAQQLLDCGVLDKHTFDQLMKGEKTVSEVSLDIRIFLKGTGSIAGVAAGPLGKMSFTEAKRQKIMPSESANMLLLAQAATGHIIDPRTNKKLTVKEACARGIVDKEDQSMLFAAESAAIGYQDSDTNIFLSVGQAMRKGLIDKDTALLLLQAQESVGGILDPSLSVFLPKDMARKQNLIDEDLYQALIQSPECYLDPHSQQPTTYVSLKKKCKSDPSTGLLLLPKPKQSITIRGLRNEVSVTDLVDANLLNKSDVDQLNAGKLTSQDIEDRLRSYLGGSTCIAGIYDEASDKVLSIYQAMKNKLLRQGTTLELLEAQAASGYMIDPVNNLFLTVAEAYNRRLFGNEFKDKLLSAEKAVTGYKMPRSGKIISLFQAIENGLVEKGHGIRLLEAQIASGGIIDPQHSHRIDVNVAFKRGYFNEEMNKILTDESDDTKGFFDPNTEENLTYLGLKKRCILDKNTGLVLLPITDKKKQESSQKNTVRKRRVIIVDPVTDKEMTILEAYNKGYIDYDTYLELSEQECEWEEITNTAPDGSMRLVIIDKSTGRQYDIDDLLEKRVIEQSDVEQYRSHAITINQFADIISCKTKHKSSSLSSSLSSSSNLTPEPSGRSSVTPSSSSLGTTSQTSKSLSSSSTSSTSRTSEVSVPASFTSSSLSSSSSTFVSRPLSPTFTKTTTTKTTITERSSLSTTIDFSDSQKHVSSASFSLSLPLEAVGEVEPVGAVFDTETVEKISITEALNRGLVDSITAQRLLEAQACTGGIVNPTNGKRLSIQEASRMAIITHDMVTKLKPAQKAYFGFEDIKSNRKLSAAQAMKERWLPYEAGQRFLEFQVATGGLYDPEKGYRRSIEDALKIGWIDVRAAQKLQDIKHHTKNLTCPKSKLKVSYKELLDNCLVEESTGVKMLQASSVSSRGISSAYNVASAPGSTPGSRSGSQRGSRRSSVDLGYSLPQYTFTSFTNFSSTK